MIANQPMRNAPQQIRSQQRVDLILETAAGLFSKVGYEAATTNAIAEKAGISIGSLYRYFPDKDAILKALVERYRREIDEAFNQLFSADSVYLPLAVLIDRFVDTVWEVNLDCPAFSHIFLSSDISPEIAEASAIIDRETILRIQHVLQGRAPALSNDRAHLLALICKAVIKALLALLASADEALQAAVRAEVKRLLLAYLEPALAEAQAGDQP